MSVHLIRFYVPALGALALLAAWLVHRMPRWLPIVALAAVVTLGGVEYPKLADGGGMPGGPGVGGPARFGRPGQGPGYGDPPPGGFRSGPPPGGFGGP